MTAKSASAPVALPGDRIVIESERVGQHPREGRIISVTESPLGPSFEVRWNDGRESSIRPAAGSAQIVHAGRGAKG